MNTNMYCVKITKTKSSNNPLTSFKDKVKDKSDWKNSREKNREQKRSWS